MNDRQRTRQPPASPAERKTATTVVHVAAGALVNPTGEILLAQRHADAHQGGLWEFPGGKLEADETVERGLKRELREELGVAVTSHRPLIRVHHRYPDRQVLLDVHRVDAWDGEPHGRESQPLAWVLPEALNDYPMPPADQPIVRALQLPSRYLITPPAVIDSGTFLRGLEQSLAGGTRLLQLRLFDLSDAELLRLGRLACDLCHAYEARVLLNGAPDVAMAIGADGVHLNSRALAQCDRRPVKAGALLAASCHSAVELARAEQLGADFALLSPVLPTQSHPDAEPLGWTGFASIVDEVALPVFALGGMSPALVETAWAHGGQGVAGIRGLWGYDADR